MRTPAEHLLGSRARVRVLEALLIAPGTVSELARAAQCAKSATSTALRQLQAAALLLLLRLSLHRRREPAPMALVAVAQWW